MFRRALSAPKKAFQRSFASWEVVHGNYVPATVTTLSNGVRVVTQPTDGIGANVSVYLDAGSRSSTIQGSAAFAHRVSMADANLHKQIENIGGAVDAHIDTDSQIYSTVLPSAGDAGRAIELLGKAVMNPEVSAETIKNVSASLIGDLNNDPRSTQEILEERCRLAAWRDGDLGYALYGTHDAAAEMTAAKLAHQYAVNQTPSRIVVSATGAVNHADIVKAAEAQFGKMTGNVPFIVPEKPYFLGCELVYRDDEMGPTAYIAIGYKAVSSVHQYAPAFQVMRQLVGNYDENNWLVPHKISGNRCKEAVSHKMGVGCIEKYNTFNMSHKDTGMIGWYVECDEIAVASAIDEMIFAFNYLSHSTTEEEVDRAKRELVATLGNSYDNDVELAVHNARTLSHAGRVIPWTEQYHRLMQLNAPEINKVAYERIHDEEIVITGLGPLHGYESYLSVRRSNQIWRYGY